MVRVFHCVLVLACWLIKLMQKTLSINPDYSVTEMTIMTQPCHNIGNPVFSCMENPRLSPSKTLQAKQQSILFKTTSSEYGAVKPCREMAPCSHHPISQRFSEPLGICGMYRNHSLNTGVDRSQVHDCLNLQHTLE
uniref:Secreted protein n=1 Tax=Leptobrachium leishanense TaxID=445787 RepID=A0A8C5PB04_9ANUR